MEHRLVDAITRIIDNDNDSGNDNDNKRYSYIYIIIESRIVSTNCRGVRMGW